MVVKPAEGAKMPKRLCPVAVGLPGVDPPQFVTPADDAVLRLGGAGLRWLKPGWQT